MTDKELQKLGRRELLQLLLEQAKEAEQLRVELAGANERAREMDATFERLKERLNDKDSQIRELQETYDRLRDRLNDKDAQIQELNDTLQLEREGQMTGLAEIGSIAEAALRLNGIFEAAQRAADLYLEKVQESSHTPRGAYGADVAVDPNWRENIPPPRRPIVDVELKEETPPPPMWQEPVRQQPVQQPVQQPLQQQPVQQQPVQQGPVRQEPADEPQAPRAQEEPAKRGLFQRKKRGDGKGKFVLSFGWEE